MQTDFWSESFNVEALATTISKPRLSKYLHVAQGELRQALQLYHWNIRLSQALYLPLHCWEIGLRNRLNHFLCWKYGTKWHDDPKLRRVLHARDIARLDQAHQRQFQKLGKPPTCDQITADLSAGFWVALLAAKYDLHFKWKYNMPQHVFRHSPQVDMSWARQSCDDLLALRNRVAHHEPIFHLPLDAQRATLGQFMRSLCPATSAYMGKACRFAHVWAQRPPA